MMIKYLPFILAAFWLSDFSLAQTTDSCDSVADCIAGEEYCAGGECVEIGSCNQLSDCFNPNNAPYPVLTCTGYIDCFPNGRCGMVCGAEECANGQDFAPCDPSNLPCDVADCREAVSCYNDPCAASGECSPVFYDSAGNIVCDGDNDEEPSVGIPPEPVLDREVLCLNDSDCNGVFDETRAYCSQGICLPMGSCFEDVDCFNPSNFYAVIECVGPIQCDAEISLCGRTCGPTFCPDGVPEVNCFADPCLDFQFGCAAAVSCVSDYCGEPCSSILFDEAGFVLEQPDCNFVNGTVVEEFAETTNTSTSTTATCTSNSDCNAISNGSSEEQYYCADGICLLMGQCKERVDCWNPTNLYPIPFCIGRLDCFDGACGVICGPQECPGGVERVPCPPPYECDITKCDGAVRCSFDGCGGTGECTELFFDAAGTQICTNGDADDDQECDSNEECGGEGLYCAQGKCLENGTCADDLDCINPSNVYPSVDCVGYTSCQAGQCAVTCGTGCVDGSDWSVCDPLPCDNTDCAAGVACANDLCNGCNAIFFDIAGNQVEDCEA